MRIAWSHRDTRTATDSRPAWVDRIGDLPSEPPRIAAPRAAEAVSSTTTPAAVQAA